MIINPYAFGGPPTTYLDSLATLPRAVLSLRKLYSTATNCIRVRRSSDNTEQNIGFAGNSLDTATLLSFVGAGNGFVVTFYDQTGNGENATQSTAANQPRIVNSGVYDGSLIFDGTNDSLMISSLTLGAPYFGVYAKIQQNTSSPVKMILETGTSVDGGVGRLAIYEGTAGGKWHIDSYNNGASTNRALLTNNTVGQHRITWLANRTVVGTGELLAWYDGVSQAGTYTTFADQTGNYTSNDVYLGARAGSSLFSTMHLETMVLYNADSSAIRASIEAVVN